MFDGLQDKLQDVFRQLKGEGKVTPEALDAALRQIRMALLEADVHLRVVKPFIDRVRERALGQEVLESLTPAQQVVKIVRDELTRAARRGGDRAAPRRPAGGHHALRPPGLGQDDHRRQDRQAAEEARQASAAGGRRPSARRRRRAAQAGRARGSTCRCWSPSRGRTVLDLGARALTVARQRGHDVVIMDTAGRLHVDTALMEEIRRLADRIQPHEILFVADSMTGQDAVKSAEQFAQVLPLTGAILTKLDGDSRGGAALSIRTVARVPIRFVGVGEKADDLELFHPERMASRMIGMGDVLSLIEKAEQGIDAAETERLAKRHRQPAVHPGGPARPAPAAPQAGPPRLGARDAPQGRPAARPRLGERGRERPQEGRGDHQLDDAARAPASGRPQRRPQEADRHGLRHLGRRRSTACSSSTGRCRR